MNAQTNNPVVWVSNFPRMELYKVGLRHKYFGKPWEAPYEQYRTPLASQDEVAQMDRYIMGYPVAREDHPEASAVYDKKCFAKQKTTVS